MFEYFSKLLDTDSFPPRWHCGIWTSGHGWLHIISDIATFGAYVTIPFVMIYFIRKRPDLPFPRIFFMFAAFIFACGTVHLIEACIFWWPIYRLSGVFKCLTAIVSWGTVISIAVSAPKALAMRTPEELEREIDSRKEAEESLRAGEERLSLVVQATSAITWDLDLRSNRFWSDAALERLAGIGPSEEDDFLTWWTERIHSEDRERFSNSFQEAISSSDDYGSRWSIDFRFQSADGTYRNLMAMAVIKRDEYSAPIRIIGAINDITETVQAQTKILQSERLSAIGEAMTGLIHESRNGLARGQAGLNLLSREIGDRPEMLRYIDEALRAQKDVQQLFEAVRQYAVVPKLDRHSTDLPELLQSVWENLRDVRSGRNATLEQQTAGADTKITVDKFLFGNVFRNLLENALAACDDPAAISVTYSDTILDGAKALEISIRDNGHGLTDEVEGSVFDAFFTTKTHGTGLGLALVKRSIEQHRGTIAPRKCSSGAEFVITLPRDQQ